MDGMIFFRDEANEAAELDAPRHSFRRAVLLTVVSVVLTLSVLIGLRLAGVPPLVGGEIATAPVAW